MAERVLDVHLEIDPDALGRERDPIQSIAELSHREALAQSERHGVRLRHPDPREVVSRQAIDAVTGRPVLLVATRWIADGPAI